MYLSLLAGRLDVDNVYAEDSLENWHNTSHMDQIKKNYNLAYHQVCAHMRFLELNPDEVVHVNRFQVSVCVCLYV